MITARPLFFALTVLLALFSTSCSDNLVSPDPPLGYVSGSGVLVSEERTVPAFHEIHSQGPITVVVQKDTDSGIRITADDNVIKKIKTSVRANGLHIALEDGEYHNIWVRVEVSALSLSKMTNSGSGTMKATGMRSEEPFKVLNSGSGDIILEGAGPALTLVNEGSGTVEAFGYRAERVLIQNQGAGNCEITCTLLLEGSNVGGGSIFYRGTPTVTAENKGAGSIASDSGQD